MTLISIGKPDVVKSRINASLLSRIRANVCIVVGLVNVYNTLPFSSFAFVWVVL